eukprot:3738862-Amphidinium_carterae.1
MLEFFMCFFGSLLKAPKAIAKKVSCPKLEIPRPRHTTKGLNIDKGKGETTALRGQLEVANGAAGPVLVVSPCK